MAGPNSNSRSTRPCTAVKSKSTTGYGKLPEVQAYTGRFPPATEKRCNEEPSSESSDEDTDEDDDDCESDSGQAGGLHRPLNRGETPKPSNSPIKAPKSVFEEMYRDPRY